MSHDGESGTATRKERRKARTSKECQAAARAGFRPADYVRNDWTTSDLAGLLEARARGYNGRLREFLCTAAARLRVYETGLEDWMDEESFRKGANPHATELMETALAMDVVEKEDGP